MVHRPERSKRPPPPPFLLCQSVVDSGALDALVACLEEFDPGVKEAAAWALGACPRFSPPFLSARAGGGDLWVKPGVAATHSSPRQQIPPS